MKKFSKVVENNNQRFYKVEAKIELIIPAENEGEAGYLADDTLSGTEFTSNYIIMNIEETSERIDSNQNK